MIKINNQNFLDLSELISEEELQALDFEMVLGLSKAKNMFPCFGYEFTRGDAALDQYDHGYKDVALAEAELTAAEKAALANMNPIEKQRFLKFAKGAYHPWAYCYCLTTEPSWQNKMSSEGKSITEEAQKLFPKTLQWCYSLPVFETIGRICIFGVDVNQHVTCHRDYDPEKWTTNDELLMLSPRGNKKFYVYDQEKKEKTYINSRLFVFSDLNYHGVDPEKYFTYSLRIDGTYTQKYKELIKFQRPVSHEFNL